MSILTQSQKGAAKFCLFLKFGRGDDLNVIDKIKALVELLDQLVDGGLFIFHHAHQLELLSDAVISWNQSVGTTYNTLYPNAFRAYWTFSKSQTFHIYQVLVYQGCDFKENRSLG